MSKHAAVLQNYNQELAKHIEFLKTQKERLGLAIEKEQEEKQEILEQMNELKKRLDGINSNLEEKCRMQNECEKTLSEAEAGFTKIIESSQVLLSLVQRESEVLKF